jgi:predicted nucleotidyltransferase
MTTDPIVALENATGSRWTAIKAAADAATEKRRALADHLAKAKLVPPDTTFVMFGSLARNEVTAGSDLDWTLLVDGQSDTQHLDVTKAIKQLVEADNKPPGPTALFGTMTFSHELVHLIGGDADTNRNTTRRILLLLESRGIVDNDPVRDRVLRNILKRYLQEDLGYHEFREWKRRVPRFLLNDIERFWRTMAVDYANKRRDRGTGWALRNFKLRLSRKLTFTAGLAMCMSCQFRSPKSLEEASSADFYGELENYLIGFSNKPPLHVVAEFVLNFESKDAGKAFEAGKAIFDAYDRFLAMLGDTTNRDHLDKLDASNAGSDKIFTEASAIGTSFQDGLCKLFFETNGELTQATQRYGVF